MNNEHPMEKIVRWGVPLGLIGLGVLFFNKIAPIFIKFFDNLTGLITSIGAAAVMFLIVGLPILYIVQNPDFVSMWWRGVSRKITTAFIKLDPLSFMDAFIDKLVQKQIGLQNVKKILEGKKLKLERKIVQLGKDIDDNMKKAKAAKSIGKTDYAIMLSNKAAGDNETLVVYKPMYERMVKYLTFFNKLDESLTINIEGTRHKVERKREEFETIKEMHKGLSAAEIFTNSQSKEVVTFQTALAALEEDVTQKIAYIDDFEKKSKGLMDGADIEKQMQDESGLRMLEQYEENGGFLLNNLTKTIDIEYETILANSTKKTSSEFSNLLLKKSDK